jgi:hypothetical protein
MEAIPSSETSVHTRTTRRHIPEDGILHSHRRENLRSYPDICFLIFFGTWISIVFIYNLLSDDASSSDCVVSNDLMISEY